MKDLRYCDYLSKCRGQLVIFGQAHVAYLQCPDISLRRITPGSLDKKYVLGFHVPMPKALGMYLLQCTSQPTKLEHDVSDQGSGEMRVVPAPKVPQVSPVRPFEHEIAIRGSADGCYESNNV